MKILSAKLCLNAVMVYIITKKIILPWKKIFFVRTSKELIPVEVKATNSKAKSLATLIAGDHYPDIQYGIKLVKGNIGFENNIYTFPCFCTFLLKRYLSAQG